MSSAALARMSKSKRETLTDFVDLVIWTVSFDTFYVWNPTLIDRIRRIVEGTALPVDRRIFEIYLCDAKDHVRLTTDAEDVGEEIELVVWAAKVLVEHNKEKLRKARFRITYQEHILTKKAKKMLYEKVADPEFLAEYWKLMPEDSAGISRDGRHKMRQEGLLNLLEKLAEEEEAEDADGLNRNKDGKEK